VISQISVSVVHVIPGKHKVDIKIPGENVYYNGDSSAISKRLIKRREMATGIDKAIYALAIKKIRLDMKGDEE